MWYVMQVRVDSEERIAQQCNTRIPKSILKRSFIPYIESRFHFHGEWVTLKRRMFLGYVFLDTDHIEEVLKYLYRMSDTTNVLSAGDEVVPLTEEEVDFLLQLGGEEQIVRISKLMLDDSGVTVLNGPLKGKEGLIKKINKHKRRIILETDLSDGLQQIEVGFEFAAEKAEQERKAEPAAQSA